MRDVELPALAVLDVAVLGRAVDREGHLVDARVDQPPRLGFGERQAVGARVEVDVRKMGLDVLAHLDGALVEERLAVVEEVDPAERRPDFVDHSLEDIEVQHAGLARLRDAGFRRAARLRARDVAGRRALDEHPRRERTRVERSNGGRLVLLQRPLERAVAAELRAPGVQVPRGGR